METLTGDHWKIHVGDVMDGLALVPTGSIQSVVTSPPYWQQRDYGFPGQIGLEKTYQEYVAKMVSVFQEVKRTLRDDGTLFLNLGDSYCKDSKFGGASGSKNAPQFEAGVVPRGYRMTSGLSPGNMVGIPWRVAFALQDDGWVLRQCIVWAKPSPMPESISGVRWKRCQVKISTATNAAKFENCPGCKKCLPNDGYVLQKGSWRPTTSHEFVFMFSKSKQYFCDGDGSKEPVSGGAHSRGDGLNQKVVKLIPGKTREHQPKQNDSFASSCSDLVETRNVRSVFHISPEGYKEAHFACYPTELVRRCLIAAISPAGCCAECGRCFAPKVEKMRQPTRPGTKTKTQKADSAGCQPSRLDANVIGNRDPKRHTTISKIIEYWPSCVCDGQTPSRSTVLDPFGGSMTTGQVAINMGCKFVGLEGKTEYAAFGVKRLEKPWVPIADRKKPRGKPRRRKCKQQAELF